MSVTWEYIQRKSCILHKMHNYTIQDTIYIFYSDLVWRKQLMIIKG